MTPTHVPPLSLATQKILLCPLLEIFSHITCSPCEPLRQMSNTTGSVSIQFTLRQRSFLSVDSPGTITSLAPCLHLLPNPPHHTVSFLMAEAMEMAKI